MTRRITRIRLAGMGVSERLFEELENQMERRGLILKKGTLMDAGGGAVSTTMMSEGRGVRDPVIVGKVLESAQS